MTSRMVSRCEGALRVQNSCANSTSTGHVGEFFDQVFADQGRVPTRAGGGDDDAFDGAQFGGRHVQAAETGGGAFEINAAAQGVFHGARLLENFLEHEVGDIRRARLPRRRIPGC